MACTLGQKSAFSLAEATITLAVLGIIASITIPSVMSRTADTRRVKLKKALEVYSNAIIIMVNENGIKPNKEKLDEWGRENDCANVRQYFKIVQNGNNNCQFRTSDGVWWDFGSPNVKVSSLSNTLVAFNQSDLDRETGWDEGTSNKAFFFHTEFDDKGKARIQDNAYSNYIGDMNGILDCAKTYAFINKKEMYDYYTVCPPGGERKSCIMFDKYYDTDKYYEAFYGNNPTIEDGETKPNKVRSNCSLKGESCASVTPSEQLANGNWHHNYCNKRQYCDDEKWIVLHGELTGKNVKIKLTDKLTREYKTCYEKTNRHNCPITATTHEECEGSYDYITDCYGADKENLGITYADKERTKIIRVDVFSGENNYWQGKASYKCNNEATVYDCIKNGN